MGQLEFQCEEDGEGVSLEQVGKHALGSVEKARLHEQAKE